MAYKNILVHYDESKNMDATLAAAIEIAKHSDAHVTGLYVIPYINTPTYAEATVPASVLKELEKVGKKAAQDASAAFEKAVKSAGCGYTWISRKGNPEEVVNKQAHYADLVVIGQTGNIHNSGASHSTENRILLGSARPVMVVPYIGIKETLGKRVMVAWNDSKESTRAVNDALPVLENASIVDVVSIVKQSEREVPSADIAQYLARHDVVAEATTLLKNSIKTSDLILNHAADRGVDMIVMGAYGHSRIREMMMGGATHNLLRHMTVPVLLSH